jgi:hypothetical protein
MSETKSEIAHEKNVFGNGNGIQVCERYFANAQYANVAFGWSIWAEEVKIFI